MASYFSLNTMNSTFLETQIPHIENPNFTFPFLYSHMTNQDCTYNFQDNFLDQDFEFSSFLDHLLVDYVPTYNNSNNTPLLEINPTMHEISSSSANSASSTTSFYATPSNINHLKEKSKVGIIKKEMIKKNERHVIAFSTKTQLEILDDGYKWRKYGKKKVKSNTNYLRNYYKCSIRGCEVKKRVERDGHDSSYLITTYEGKHNHEINSSIIYNNHVETDSEFELNFHRRGGKRVERDHGHDSTCMITTYEGKHNHESCSSIICSHEMPLNFLNEWTLKTTS